MPKPPPIAAPEKEPEEDPKPKPKPRQKPKPEQKPLPEPDDKEDPCKPVPQKHLGGHTDSNYLADSYPPNRIPGMDWYLKGRNVLKGKNYDSYSTTGILWEIKAWRYKYYKKDIKIFALAKAKGDIKEEKLIANSCSIPYSFGCTSKVLIADLRTKAGIASPGYSIVLVRDDKV